MSLRLVPALALTLVLGGGMAIAQPDPEADRKDRAEWRALVDKITAEVEAKPLALRAFDLPPGLDGAIAAARYRGLSPSELEAALDSKRQADGREHLLRLFLRGPDEGRAWSAARDFLENQPTGKPAVSLSRLTRAHQNAIKALRRVLDRRATDLERLGDAPKLEVGRKQSERDLHRWLDRQLEIKRKHEPAIAQATEHLEALQRAQTAREAIRALFYSGDRRAMLLALKQAQRIEGAHSALPQFGSLARPFGSWHHAQRAYTRDAARMASWLDAIREQAPKEVVADWDRLQSLIGQPCAALEAWPAALREACADKGKRGNSVLIVFWEGGDPSGALRRIATKFAKDRIIGVTRSTGIFADERGRIWGLPRDEQPPAGEAPSEADYWQRHMQNAVLVTAKGGRARPARLPSRRKIPDHLEPTAGYSNLIVAIDSDGKVVHLQDLSSPLEWIDAFIQ